MANLDLVLVKSLPGGGTEEVWRSNSTKDNVEHIFRKLKAGDADYELWVENRSKVATTYAIAWWGEAATPRPPTPKMVSGSVWEDTDRDGLHDVGERARSGISIDLVEVSTGQTVSTASSDADGLSSNLLGGGRWFRLSLLNLRVTQRL